MSCIPRGQERFRVCALGVRSSRVEFRFVRKVTSKPRSFSSCAIVRAIRYGHVETQPAHGVGIDPYHQYRAAL